MKKKIEFEYEKKEKENKNIKMLMQELNSNKEVIKMILGISNLVDDLGKKRKEKRNFFFFSFSANRNSYD